MNWLLWLVLLFATACAPGNPHGGSYESSSPSFTIEIPEGWRKLNTSRHFIITREGPFSQYILLQQRHVDKPFRFTKGRFNRDMLPQEAAQVLVDEISSDPFVLKLQIIEKAPATVDRYEGFRIVFTYENKDGLKFRTFLYGFLRGEWFYNIRYNAQERHFTLKDIDVLERVLNSFKIKEAPSA